MIDDPVAAARVAGLRYLSDDAPGIVRRPGRGGFRYVTAEGRPVRDAETLRRIGSLAIPPAWQDVWVSPRSDGHLQATGRDAKGRKQYRYHRRWREIRDETKYHRMIAFGRVLPRIRRRVAADLRRNGLARERILAAVVRLLEATLIRVGNEQYARRNDSYGLTTLRGRQVDIAGATVKFRFRGKSGVRHEVRLVDRRMARIVRRMQELPGHELFQYVDEAGDTRAVESADVNAYLREASGEDFTSKDFRTWHGTVRCAAALMALERDEASRGELRRNVNRAVEAVAAQLGNTRAVCRKCYIHPGIIESYEDGELRAGWGVRPGATARSASGLGLSAEEAVVLALLQKRARREAALAARSGATRPLAPLLARSLGKLARPAARASAA